MNLTQRSGQPFRLPVLLLGLLLAGCAASPTGLPPRAEVTAFSTATPGGKFPYGWAPWALSRFKRNSEYQLVRDANGVTVIEAKSDRSASGMMIALNIEPSRSPFLQWRWSVPHLIAEADNTRRDAEDSPVRLVIAFDGDMAALDVDERMMSQRIKALTGRALPYATLMYIWENKLPVGTVIDSAHTTRVKMVVAESGPANEGRWIDLERNVVEDFKRAFGEPPGRIKSLGILTDTDNTETRSLAYYGDIRFAPRSVNTVSPTKPD